MQHLWIVFYSKTRQREKSATLFEWNEIYCINLGSRRWNFLDGLLAGDKNLACSFCMQHCLDILSGFLRGGGEDFEDKTRFANWRGGIRCSFLKYLCKSFFILLLFYSIQFAFMWDWRLESSITKLVQFLWV